ncbi:hypothetical protein [Aestuariicoccus sp. MJ-SS9]|uniref:hypothetical protein n=1 Tax=Aestuariicoccus sp. MJ-SS9 TaxID=3079855 RepID=UPI00290DD319|nr:hypothetical protein [Aestuariicoccus sp. MJ-SS9]MDU8909704.1 hypothetical protein [Aestuariicoccus sp. MJ-SS9]
MRVLCLLAVWALPAQAFEIDYPALFDHHAAEVQQATPDRRILELPGPVIVTDYNGMYTATDQSSWGAAGCAIDRVFEIAAAVQLCPETLGDADRESLSRLVVEAAAFYAANTFPPLGAGELPAFLDTALASRRAAIGAGICGDPSAPWTGFAAYLASGPGRARMAQVFETPRLPVMHPCP